MPEFLTPVPAAAPPRPPRPWPVTVATCLLVTATLTSLVSAGLTGAIIDSSLTRSEVALDQAGYGDYSPRVDLMITMIGVGAWFVVGIGLAIIAVAAGSGRILAYRAVLAMTLVVLAMACCCGNRGPIALYCPFSDTCGELRGGFPSWYLAVMPTLAWVQAGAWVSGVALFALTKASRAYMRLD